MSGLELTIHSAGKANGLAFTPEIGRLTKRIGVAFGFFVIACSSVKGRKAGHGVRPKPGRLMANAIV